jgi:hypothetical protein
MALGEIKNAEQRNSSPHGLPDLHDPIDAFDLPKILVVSAS